MNYTKKDIKRYVDGDCNIDESLEILKYVRTAEGIAVLEESIDESIDVHKGVDQDPDVPEILLKPFSRTLKEEKSRRIRRFFMIAAAAALPLLLSVLLYAYYDRQGKETQEYVEIYVPRGERKEVYFQDGTHIWMSADSRISFPKYFSAGKREVSLTGEAYFEVESNRNQPFFVRLDKSHIVVTGTEFNVNAYSDNDQIVATLNEGNIAFITEADGKEYLLKPSQQVSFDKGNGKVILRRVDDAVASDWRNGVIRFENASLRKVMADLSRQYDVNFKLKDKQLEDLLFTISFTNQDLPSILSELQLIANLQFVIRDREVSVRKMSN